MQRGLFIIRNTNTWRRIQNHTKYSPQRYLYHHKETSIVPRRPGFHQLDERLGRTLAPFFSSSLFPNRENCSSSDLTLDQSSKIPEASIPDLAELKLAGVLEVDAINVVSSGSWPALVTKTDSSSSYISSAFLSVSLTIAVVFSAANFLLHVAILGTGA